MRFIFAVIYAEHTAITIGQKLTTKLSEAVRMSTSRGSGVEARAEWRREQSGGMSEVEGRAEWRRERSGGERRVEEGEEWR